MAHSLEVAALSGRRSIRGEVGHALRAALVSGEMRPGEVYSAPKLAAQFGVSATPVREAMLDLVNEGLVTIAPNKGFLVRELTVQELDDITEIRQLLEVPATANLAGGAMAKDLEPLRSLAVKVIASAQSKDLINFVEYDRQFHLGLLALTSNAELVTLVASLRSRARLYGIARLADTGELIVSANEHLEILDLIALGDREGVATVMERHIGHVRGDNA